MVGQRAAIRRRRRVVGRYAAAILVGLLLIITTSAGVEAQTEGDRPVTGEVGGRLTYGEREPAAGIAVDLFAAQHGGGRDHYLDSTLTDETGRYRFAVEDGCYVLVAIAPDGQGFLDTGRYRQTPVCVKGGRAEWAVDGTLRPVVAVVTGRVEYRSGGPVAQVVIDLFRDDEDGNAAGFITSIATRDDGTYTLALPSEGCHRLVFLAPEGNSFVGGEAYAQREVCAADGEQIDGVDAVVTEPDRAQLGGRISDEGGAGVEGLTVDLFRAAGDGSRGSYLRSTATDVGGRYSFDLPPACYVLVLIAGESADFVGTGPYRQLDRCVTADEVVSSLDAQTVGTSTALTELTTVELELARLTNELRRNPAGPLARRKPMPTCVDDLFYDIAINPESGHPTPVAALRVNETVSLEMARPWATDMQTRSVFEHRPSDAQQEIYTRLDLPVSAWGENIAWFAGYGEAETAQVHFEGWRESDTGHYCSMVTPRFTHLGVGERRVGDESWAVQNFYTSYP